jgi:cytochrome c5
MPFKEDDAMKKTLVVVIIAAVLALAFTAAFAERSGKELYESVCSACHETGQLDAPVYGTGDWADLAKEGIDQLLKDAIAGVDDMPAKGGCGDCTEAEIKAAIQYMLDSAK